MNEERQQAYLNLIQELYNCASAEEINNLLEANLDLVDEELLATMEQVAVMSAEEGDEETAIWLRNLAEDLTNWINDAVEASLEEYIAFLQEVLQAEEESNSDPQVVYPILQRHQDKLDATFAQLLQDWARNVFAEGSAEDIAAIAGVIGNLCIHISEFPFGKRTDNIEIAIIGYETILEVYTRQAYAYEWATAQNNLGIAYSNRRKGKKAENLEKAIKAYKNALEVHTRQAYAYDWATAQNNLGTAYSDRHKGKKAKNLEKAIKAYKNALEIHIRQAYAYEWARTQNNLGIAYRNRFKGERAKNLEKAIEAHEKALEIHTRQAYPYDWATTQNNLGNAYSDRIRGEKAENLEQAISAYEHALEVFTREAYPDDWAGTQNNLGAAYGDRIKGERNENLERAIRACEHALEVFTREAYPYDWAKTQNNLGFTYQNKGEITQAIEAYRSALEIRTPTQLPLDCLRTGCNLGNLGYEQENWQIAIEGYSQAIEAVEQSREWATSPQGKREILKEASDIYENLVQACLNANQLDKAIETVERSKSRYLVELLTSIDITPPEDASETERHKYQQYKELRRRIDAMGMSLEDSNSYGEIATQGETGTRGSRMIEVRRDLQRFQGQLNQLLDEIGQSYPDFTVTQRVEPISLTDIQALLDPETAILEWYISSDRFYTSIIIQDSIDVVSYNADDLESLETWKSEYLNDYRQTTWTTALADRLNHLADILKLPQILAKIPTENKRLILVPHRYLHLFPLHALPVNPPVFDTPLTKGGWGGSHLHDLFPDGISYAPSCQLLQRLHQRQKITPPNPFFFAIQNPTQDLRYTDLEVETIKQAFDPNSFILKGSDASKINFNRQETLEHLRRSYYAHFSCHGGFNFQSPLDSALFLAGSIQIPTEEVATETPEYVTLRDGRRGNVSEGLTLREIFASLELPLCQLVTLSACETGLTYFNQEEYVGLASGFLYAGSLHVVNSLWCVDDFATAILMIQFYQLLLDKDKILSVSQALQEAQKWIRETTRKEMINWFNSLQLNAQEIENLTLVLRLYDDPPFADLQYWAAFCSVGR